MTPFTYLLVLFWLLCGFFQTIYNAMMNGTPCVMLEGSGRIADVISHVSGLPISQITIALVSQLMERFFGQEYKSFTTLRIIEWTKKVCRHTGVLGNYDLSVLVCEVDVAVTSSQTDGAEFMLQKTEMSVQKNSSINVCWDTSVIQTFC